VVGHLRPTGSIENGVLFGRDGQFFLADGGHAVLDFALGRRAADRDSIETFWMNVGLRSVAAAKIGIPYVHVIFPDKQSVLVDQFPFGQPVCLGEIYLNAALHPADTVLSEGPSSRFGCIGVSTHRYASNRSWYRDCRAPCTGQAVWAITCRRGWYYRRRDKCSARMVRRVRPIVQE
jgi:hypothetical protein